MPLDDGATPDETERALGHLTATMTRARRYRRIRVTALGVIAIAAIAVPFGLTRSPAARSLKVIAPAPSASTPPSGTAPGPPTCGDPAAPAGPRVGALQTVQFVTTQAGWAAGSGRILATADGGRSWHQQYSGSAQIVQIDFVNRTDGWALDSAGALLRTTSGGAGWTPLPAPCLPLRQVHFATPMTGWAVAGGGHITGMFDPGARRAGSVVVRTGDGGRTWQTVAGAPAAPTSVCFTSPTDGWVGTVGRIWKTTDAGGHWSLSLAEPPATGAPSAFRYDTPAIECSGPDAAWALFLGEGAALGNSPYLAYATTDGITWRPVLEEGYIEGALRPQLHAPNGPGSYPGPFSVISPATAVFAGEDPAGAGSTPLVEATNGGASLIRTGRITHMASATSIAFTDPEHGWATGIENSTDQAGSTTYVIESTSDGGSTWSLRYQVP